MAVLGAVLAAPLTTNAQPAEKVYRIGYLSAGSGSRTGNPRVLEAFRQELREHGGQPTRLSLLEDTPALVKPL